MKLKNDHEDESSSCITQTTKAERQKTETEHWKRSYCVCYINDRALLINTLCYLQFRIILIGSFYLCTRGNDSLVVEVRSI